MTESGTNDLHGGTEEVGGWKESLSVKQIQLALYKSCEFQLPPLVKDDRHYLSSVSFNCG